MSHRRSRSHGRIHAVDPLITNDWTETSRTEGTLPSLKGAARGVTKAALGAGSRFLGSASSRTATKADPVSILDSPPYRRAHMPPYEGCVSSKYLAELPEFNTTSTIPTNPVLLEVGPDEGFFECVDDMVERKKLLKSWAKLLLQDANALRHPECDLAKYDLGGEEVKLKQGSLKAVEKHMKKVSMPMQMIRRDRWNATDTRIHGRSMDTYAFDCVLGKKASDPNADSYYAEGFARMICFGVADGIGWGVPSRRAAQAALLGFSTKLKEQLIGLLQANTHWNTTLLASACYEAVHVAHTFTQALTEGKTTLAGGVVVKLPESTYYSKRPSVSERSLTLSGSAGSEDEPPQMWTFVGASVGDSLIYRFSRATENVLELTTSDRTRGVRDAGGSLGGVKTEGDLRNFSLHLALLNEGDFVISMSDGVHDNLDPEVLQITPSLAAKTVHRELTQASWSDVPDDEKNYIKRRYKEHQLETILRGIPRDTLTSKAIVFNVLQFAFDCTADHRKAYETGSRLQKDWDRLDPAERDQKHLQVKEALRNPKGKFDHVTCLCIEAR